MPIADPYAAKPKAPKKPTASSPAPAYPMAAQQSPDQMQALMDQGYVDYGDGELIPPMEDMGASAAGGPAGPQTEIRSDIFKGLYKAGRQSGNPTLMDMGRPPMPEADPFAWMQPAPEPELRVMPELPPSPQAPPYAQASVDQMKPGQQAMQRRFPRATSLMAGARNAPPLRRGR